MLMSIIRGGQSDIVEYDVKAGKFRDITNDIYDDITPRYSLRSNGILFVSNRSVAGDTATDFYSIFEIDSALKSVELIVGSDNSITNYYQPNELQNGYISFLSDANGIINNYAIKRGDNRILQLTSYKRSILYNDVAPEAGQIADLVFYNNKYRIYIGELSENLQEEALESISNTAYRIWLIENKPAKTKKTDSTGKDSSKALQDTVKSGTGIQKKKKVFISGFSEYDNIEISKKTTEKSITFIRQKAVLNFGVNYFLQQFDNSFLNNSLFPSGVNEEVFNYPLLNPLIQTKITDYLNNYQIEAGIRISINIKASDYFIRYTSLKGRWDKSISFFRRGRVFENERTAKRMVTEQLKFSASYPFNQRSKLNIYSHLRQDRYIPLIIDTSSQSAPTAGNIYTGGGVEYVYDNIKSRGLNTFEGLRFKIYSDNYIGMLKTAGISNNGFDGRYYLKVHRQIYLATRLSGAFSLGPQKTAYYLGGVENQPGKARASDNFNYSIPTLTEPVYSFQTLASPMRGFLRNTRGGSNYVLLNTELRVPILSYLIQKPITSEFLRSIMFTGFIDVGTAWQGSSPYDISNPFNTRIIVTPSYTATVISRRDPMLYATGIGARAKILGHYIKVDYGWGYIEKKFQTPLTTISLGLDF